MKKEDLKKIFVGSLSGFIALAFAVFVYFIIARFGQIQGFFHWIIEILKPFVWGGMLAFLMKSPCNTFDSWFERILPEKWRKHVTGLSVLLTSVLVFAGLYGLMSSVLPQIVESVSLLINALPDKINQLTDWINRVMENNSVLHNYANSTVSGLGDYLNEWSKETLMPTLQDMMGGIPSTVTSIVMTIYDIFISAIVCIYILCSRKIFARQGKAVIYAVFRDQTADWILQEITFVNRTFVGFFAGKILDSAIVGLICFVFCTIMTFITDFPNALLISLITGVTNVIPYFGPFIGAVPCALLILMESPLNCLIFLVFILILQQIDGNILGPKLLSGTIGLSGFWVLFSITLMGGLFGFMGVLVGVPVFAVLYDFAKRLVVRGLKRHNHMELLDSSDGKNIPVLKDSGQPAKEANPVLSQNKKSS